MRHIHNAPGFGQPGSVRPDIVRRLPAAMQHEAVLLAREIGEVAAFATGLHPDGIAAMLRHPPRAFRYDAEVSAPEGAE